MGSEKNAAQDVAEACTLQSVLLAEDEFDVSFENTSLVTAQPLSPSNYGLWIQVYKNMF